MKHTKGPGKVKHSESKNAFNVIGTALGGKYKIARCPYLVTGYAETDKREKEEAAANAGLIAAAPDLLQFAIDTVKDIEEIGMQGDFRTISIYNEAKAVIKKATL